MATDFGVDDSAPSKFPEPPELPATTGFSDHSDPPQPLRFERRTTDRWEAQGAATAFRLGGDEFGRMHELKILDYSHGGLGAISATVIEPGTILSIGFQAPGRYAKRGIVRRCTPCGEGYRVAIEFEARMAA